MPTQCSGTVIGEILTTYPDPKGRKFGDKHRVAVKKNLMTVGHLPKQISRLGEFFVVHGGTIQYKVTGKSQRSKMPRGGLEVDWRCSADQRESCHHASTQRQAEVHVKNMVVSPMKKEEEGKKKKKKKKKKLPIYGQKISRKNNYCVRPIALYHCIAHT